MHQSPFVNGAGFTSADDARRKSEEVRSYLGLGLGPIGDIEAASELMGITVYQACLGSDLSETISGAFLNHAEIGFSIVINLEMTPGRRRFTVAHELAHALFHSDDYQYAVSTAAKPPRERFADAFAGEFLMPTEGLRRVMEDQEFGVKIEDPSAVIYLQRFFGVSYVTALVRLRQANFLSQRLFNDFKRVRPVILAESLGYDVASEEYTQPPEIWRRNRYPQRFLRLIRSAVIKEIVSISTISSLTQLTVDEITEIVTDGINLATHNEEELAEMKEFEVTGVLGGN
jgi:Zn-dependent peptidase ImmA (M78 family)